MPQTELASHEISNLMTFVSVGKGCFPSDSNWPNIAEQLYAKLGRMLHAIDNQPDDISTMQRRIDSIGWLHNVNGIALTPCMNGNGHALRVDITYEEFDTVKHDSNAMKRLAAIKILERRLKAGTI